MTFEDHKFLRLARLPFRHPGKILEGLYRLRLKSAMTQIFLEKGREVKPKGSTDDGELWIESPWPWGFSVPEVLEMLDTFKEGNILSSKMIRRFQEICPLGCQHGEEEKK